MMLEQRLDWHRDVCRLSCGRHVPFTCAAECDKLNDNPDDSLDLPRNVTCPVLGEHQLASLLAMHCTILYLLPLSGNVL